MPKAAESPRTGLNWCLCMTGIGCSYTVLEMLKADILNVISEYMEIDDEELDIRLTHIKETSGEVPVLYANIPIRSMRMAKSG